MSSPANPAQPPRRFALSVSRMAWAFGCVIASLLWGIGVWKSLGADAGLRFTWWNIALAVPFVLAGGWGLAALYERVPRRPNPRLGWLVSAVVWVVAAGLLRRAYLEVLSFTTGVGTTERLILAAPLAALLLGCARRTGLGKWTTRIAILLIVIGFVRVDDTDMDSGRVTSAAGPGDIAKAQRGGAPRLLLGDASRGGTPNPAPAGGHCQRATVNDTRRTLLGFVSRTVHADVQVCWAGDGKPASVIVSDQAEGVDGRAQPRRIALVGSDPFALAGPSNRQLQHPEPQPKSAGGTPHGLVLSTDGKAPDDDTIHDDTVVMRAASSGRTIDVIVAWELRDPSARRRIADPSLSGGWVDNPVQTYSPRPLPGVTIDAFVVSFDRIGDPSARLVRLGVHGQRDLALQRNDDPQPHIVGSQPVVRLVGGQ